MIELHDKGLNPSNFLVENIDLLPGGHALDVAMGNGRNAIYLAERGFHVLGIDISKEAITEALELAAISNVNITAHVADLTTGSHIQPGIYDLIICFNYLQRSLIPEIRRGLRSGGVIVYETFIVDQARYGKPKNPNHLLKHNELLRMFRDFRCIRYHEGVLEEKKAVAGIIAEKGV